MKSAVIGKAYRLLLVSCCVAWPAFGADKREEFVELVRKYARGDRTQAIAGLSAWNDRELERQLNTTAANERCVACSKLTPALLRAAIMLHADTDRASAPVSLDVEQPRRCPGRLAILAGRYAALLALRPDGRDFASRFYLYMALRCQWDACFENGLQWARDGLALFPRDPRLLFAVGSNLDQNAVLGGVEVRALTAPLASAQRALMLSRARDESKLEAFREARRFFESALKVDPERDLARLRLGIVAWRLRDLDAAQTALREVIERPLDPKALFLAHLFLGRVHEDAGRSDDADSEYRLALALDPGAQSAAIALSHLRRLQGDGEASRQLLRSALSYAPRLVQRDVYWDYLGGSDEHLESLLAGLHRDAEGE